MSEHRQEFDNELDAIESKVIELFAMVAEDVPLATQALLNGDAGVAATLAARDQAIDALYLEVEALANKEILLQAPVASDLRFLLSVLRIVPELERSHDLVVHIAIRPPPRGAEPLPRGRAPAASQGPGGGDGRSRRRDVAEGGRLVVRARPGCRDEPGRARREHGRTARQPHRRDRFRAGGGPRGHGDGPDRPGLRAARRACGEHRPPRDLPGGHRTAQAQRPMTVTANP